MAHYIDTRSKVITRISDILSIVKQESPFSNTTICHNYTKIPSDLEIEVCLARLFLDIPQYCMFIETYDKGTILTTQDNTFVYTITRYLMGDTQGWESIIERLNKSGIVYTEFNDMFICDKLSILRTDVFCTILKKSDIPSIIKKYL